MEFPVTLTGVHHKAGGTITRITGIGHALDTPQDGRSRDYWYFRGDVKWRDGSKSADTEIAPYAVCYSDEDHKQQVDALMAALNDYLLANGKWCRGDGKHEGWYAHRTPSKKRRAA